MKFWKEVIFTFLSVLIVLGIILFFVKKRIDFSSNQNEPTETEEKQEQKEKNETKNFLLIGTDYQPNVLDYGEYDEKGLYHKPRKISCDTLILLQINEEKEKFVISSIPSDIYVNESQNIKLSDLYAEKGIDSLLERITVLTGVKVDYFAAINIEECAKAFDETGNISFNVPCDMYYVDEVQNLKIDFKRGTQQLSGSEALSVLRYCSFSDDSITRESVGVSFLKGLISKMLSPIYLPKAASVFGKIISKFDTNYTLDDFTKKIGKLSDYADYEKKTVSFPGESIEKNSEKVFVPNLEEAKKVYSEFKN